ncbi:MAG: hypothetical protein J6S51_05390 [Kiritimatiellae bacterium]|nr:hypothetical protein [Kiritimatiellia bacterium]
MDVQSVLSLSRVTQVRQLKAEISKLKSENMRLHDENASLLAHLDMAIAAAVDLSLVGEGGRFIIIDGWNMILGARKRAADRKELLGQVRELVAQRPQDFVWIVYDGPKRSSVSEGRIRVSYTGGTGPHRADKLVCDFLRMARLRADTTKIELRTSDIDFLKEANRILNKA